MMKIKLEDKLKNFIKYLMEVYNNCNLLFHRKKLIGNFQGQIKRQEEIVLKHKST